LAICCTEFTSLLIIVLTKFSNNSWFYEILKLIVDIYWLYVVLNL